MIKCLKHCFCKLLNNGTMYCCKCGEHEIKKIKKYSKSKILYPLHIK